MVLGRSRGCGYDRDHMQPERSPFPPESLAARLLATLAPSAVRRHIVARGAAVFRQGDPATTVYVVETGRIRMARVLEDGTPLTLFVAEAGDSFAEASLSAAHYHCDAIAETDAVVLALPKTGLLTALAADPAQSLSVTLALASQVRDLRARLELRNIRSAALRVLAWLRLHASGNPPAMPLHRPWTMVAEELGLTREVLYRALAMLERQGQIQRKPGFVKLLVGDGKE